MFHDCQIVECSEANYQDWPANRGLQRGDPNWTLRRGEICDLLECGELFQAGGREVSNNSVRIGSLVDCLLLSPDEFPKRYIVHPEKFTTGGEEKEWNPRAEYCRKWKEEHPPPKPPEDYYDQKGKLVPWNPRNKFCRDWKAANPPPEPPKTYRTPVVEHDWSWQRTYCQEWRKEKQAEGFEVISPKDLTLAQNIAQAVRHKQPSPRDERTLGQLLEWCDKQVIVVGKWKDKKTGIDVPLRCMLDMSRTDPPIAYDLKTAAEVSLRKFKGSIIGFGYDIQAFMYSELFRHAIDAADVPFGFVTVRNTLPALVATYRTGPGEETWQFGKEKFERAMRIYCDALENGFKGYTEGFVTI